MMLSALFDFPDDAGEAVYDKSSLRAMMIKLHETGVRRIYWHWYGDANHDFFWTTPMTPYVKCVKTAQLVPDFNQEIVRLAKEYGLETVGVIRPYETGLSASMPPYGVYQQIDAINALDGKLLCLTRFVARNPDLRIKRRTYDLDKAVLDRPICSIKLYKADNAPAHITRDDITIYVSNNNTAYKKCETDFSFSVSREAALKDIHSFGPDYTEPLVTRKGDTVTVITLSGMSIREKFVALQINGQNCSQRQSLFQNTVQEIIRCFDQNGEDLHLSTGNKCNIWNRPDFSALDREKVSPLDIGFGFDTGFGGYLTTLDEPDKTGFIAICKGKNEYLAGALCECEPDVQEYFMETVRECLAAGFDTISFRIESHSTHTDEPFAFGYNDCVRQEYLQRYGPCSEQEMELAKISKIRGDAFTNFLKKAAELTHQTGRKFDVTLNTELLRQKIPAERHLAYPMTVEWQWQRWLNELSPDSVTIRTYKHTPQFVFSDPDCLALIEAARVKRLPMTYLRYINKNYIQDMEFIDQKGGFESIILYEVYNFIKSDEKGGIIVKQPEFIEQVKNKAEALAFAK